MEVFKLLLDAGILAALYYAGMKMGRLERALNGTMREWAELKRVCPLCPKKDHS